MYAHIRTIQQYVAKGDKDLFYTEEEMVTGVFSILINLFCKLSSIKSQKLSWVQINNNDICQSKRRDPANIIWKAVDNKWHTKRRILDWWGPACLSHAILLFVWQRQRFYEMYFCGTHLIIWSNYHTFISPTGYWTILSVWRSLFGINDICLESYLKYSMIEIIKFCLPKPWRIAELCKQTPPEDELFSQCNTWVISFDKAVLFGV